jgi:teichuronic acid biosynthesis glycosyltransferase TuaC
MRTAGADTLAPVRVLTVSLLTPDAAAPQRGRWVLDQVEEIRERGVEVEMFDIPLGGRNYPAATRRLRSRLREGGFDLVHAHYGLAGWCAKLAGARPLVVTFHGTDVRHRLVGPLSRSLAGRLDLCAAVSRALFGPEDGRPGLPPVAGRAVLPCGPDLRRFVPMPRAEARRELGLDPDRPFLFFPANPARLEKRHDRAVELARAADAELRTGGGIDPDLMPLWVNAANAVVLTSDNEGLGLVALESLACDVPALSTPVGIAPHAISGIAGCLVAPFSVESWAPLALQHLGAEDPRIEGRRRAESFAAGRMAERVVVAYRELLA